MCLGILINQNRQINIYRLWEAYNANPDGCGIMTIWNDRLFVLKGCWDWKIFSKAYNLVKNSFAEHIIVHFRTASNKGIAQQFCHPHFINPDLAFVHNGNFFEFSSYFGNGRSITDTRTDTQRFNEEVLQKLPDNFLYLGHIKTALEKYCKNNMSKMIFMNSNGMVWIINEDAGEWQDGCWFSNKGMSNYAGYGYSGAYYYDGNPARFKGGLPTVQMFPEKIRKHWWRCPECLGWYPASEQYIDLCEGCRLLYELKYYCEKEGRGQYLEKS